MAKPKKSKKQTQSNTEELIPVDPTRIRYQHSRIRPHFSGCGRSVTSTLQSIKDGNLSIDELPPIQVLIGPTDKTGTWYFSLNNRRLWVAKQLRSEGYLTDRNPSNTILVRVREPKSKGERERYTLENCSVDAKFMREKVKDDKMVDDGSKSNDTAERKEADVVEKINEDLVKCSVEDKAEKQDAEEVESESESESDDEVTHSNPFSALM